MKRVLSMFAATALVVPSLLLAGQVRAAGVGDLVRCPDFSSVYYLAEDGRRYVFPNESVYYSWYSDFEDVRTVSCEDLASFSLGERVQYQAGTSLVKIPSVPTVYAVEPDGVLRPIPDEDTAKTLYGDDWASRVDDLSEAFFGGYDVGEELAEDELPEGMILEDEDGSLYRVDEEGDAEEIDVVLDTDEEDVFETYALPAEALEARLGKVIELLEVLTTEIERLAALLAELKLVDVEAEDEVEVEELDEIEDEAEDADDAQDAIDDAKEEISEAKLDLAEDEADGKDVSGAQAYLESAEANLADAESAFAAGDYGLAEDLADEAKHDAMWARGKAVESIDEDEDEEETDEEDETEMEEGEDDEDEEDADEEDADETDEDGEDDEEGEGEADDGDDEDDGDDDQDASEEDDE